MERELLVKLLPKELNRKGCNEMPKDKHLDDVRFQPGIVQSTTEVAQRSAYK